MYALIAKFLQRNSYEISIYCFRFAMDTLGPELHYTHFAGIARIECEPIDPKNGRFFNWFN